MHTYKIEERELEFGRNELELPMGSTILSCGPGMNVNLMVPTGQMSIVGVCTILVCTTGQKIDETMRYLGGASSFDGRPTPIHFFEIPTINLQDPENYEYSTRDDSPNPDPA